MIFILIFWGEGVYMILICFSILFRQQLIGLMIIKAKLEREVPSWQVSWRDGKKIHVRGGI